MDQATAMMDELHAVLKDDFGIPVAALTETDRRRIRAFIEALEEHEVALPTSEANVETWFEEEIQEGLETQGEPVTIVTLAICATIAFCTWRNPNFLPATLKGAATVVRETGKAAKQVLESEAGASLVKGLSKFFGIEDTA